MRRPAPRAPAAPRAPSRRPGASACRPAGRRPGGRRRRPVPTTTPSGPTDTSPAGERRPSGSGVTGPSRSRSPRHVVQAPGAGVTPRIRRSTTCAGSAQSIARVGGLDPRRQADPLGRLRLGDEAAVGDPVEGGDQQPGAADGQPAQQVAGGVPRADRLGHRAEDRPGVQPGLEAERRGAGDLVAGHDRVLHGRRPAPGRQQREVQVDPAVPGQVERGLRHQRAVGDDRRAVDVEGGELLEELRFARRPGLQDRDPRGVGPLGHRVTGRPSGRGRSGRRAG